LRNGTDTTKSFVVYREDRVEVKTHTHGQVGGSAAALDMEVRSEGWVSGEQETGSGFRQSKAQEHPIGG
jgi:hypothetical protein